MRRRARRDANHADITRELRQLGVSVMETHQLGDDAPDIVCGFRGITALVEIKPAETTARRTHDTQRVKRERLARQIAYLEAWRGGPAFVASTTEEILNALVDAARERNLTT